MFQPCRKIGIFDFPENIYCSISTNVHDYNRDKCSVKCLILDHVKTSRTLFFRPPPPLRNGTKQRGRKTEMGDFPIIRYNGNTGCPNKVYTHL